MLSPLYHAAWFTPQEKQWKIPSEPLRVTPSLCACLSANASSFLKLGLPSWTPNAANCSFLCITPAKHYINRDEERVLSFPGLYFRCLEISEEGNFWEGAIGFGFVGSEYLNERKRRWMIEAQHCLLCMMVVFFHVRDVTATRYPMVYVIRWTLRGFLSIVFHFTHYALNLHLEVVSLPQHWDCSSTLSILCISLSHSCFLLPSAQVSLASPKSRVLPRLHTPQPISRKI